MTIKFWNTKECKEYKSLKVSGHVYSILPIYFEETEDSYIVISHGLDDHKKGNLSLYDLNMNLVKIRYKNANNDIINSIIPLYNLELKYFAAASKGEIKIWKTAELAPVITIP